ncbi:uncharacterized protein [Struthio camelus]|uniref:uncharacterized protein n=1 Tax=Struthio camelus TaxID=8801 RepID=UPI003603D678
MKSRVPRMQPSISSPACGCSGAADTCAGCNKLQHTRVGAGAGSRRKRRSTFLGGRQCHKAPFGAGDAPHLVARGSPAPRDMPPLRLVSPGKCRMLGAAPAEWVLLIGKSKWWHGHGLAPANCTRVMAASPWAAPVQLNQGYWSLGKRLTTVAPRRRASLQSTSLSKNNNNNNSNKTQRLSKDQISACSFPRIQNPGLSPTAHLYLCFSHFLESLDSLFKEQ